MKSAKAMASTTLSAIVGLGSALSAIADWMEKHAWQIAAVVAAFCISFVSTLLINDAALTPDVPAEAVSPVTVVEVPGNTVTIVTQVLLPPASAAVPRPTDKAAVPVTTTTGQTPQQENTTTVTLPSTSASASETTSAHSEPEPSVITTSASPELTTSVSTPAAPSEAP